jgi:hypothetical protein
MIIIFTSDTRILNRCWCARPAPWGRCSTRLALSACRARMPVLATARSWERGWRSQPCPRSAAAGSVIWVSAIAARFCRFLLRLAGPGGCRHGGLAITTMSCAASGQPVGGSSRRCGPQSGRRLWSAGSRSCPAGPAPRRWLAATGAGIFCWHRRGCSSQGSAGRLRPVVRARVRMPRAWAVRNYFQVGPAVACGRGSCQGGPGLVWPGPLACAGSAVVVVVTG